MEQQRTPAHSTGKMTPRERATLGIQTRLAREDPHAMTAAANASSRNVGSLRRWEQVAREQEPGAGQAALTRRAEELRHEYFAGLARKSAATRRGTGAARADRASA